MTDDLVKRLRDFDPHMMHEWEVTDEAADRIEALTAEHNATLARLAGAVAREIALLAEREELVECNEQFFVDNQFLKKRVEAAEAENDRAWAALWDILACETPNANATVTRMVAIAKAALRGENHD